MAVSSNANLAVVFLTQLEDSIKGLREISTSKHDDVPELASSTLAQSRQRLLKRRNYSRGNRSIIDIAGGIVMVRILLLLPLLFLLSNCDAKRSRVLSAVGEDEPFISVWKVEAGEPIRLPLVKGYAYDFVVDWGDGSQSKITSAEDLHREHVYAVTGSYTLRISGLVEAWQEKLYGDCAITSVPDLGDVGWKSLRGAFARCFDLVYLQGGNVSAVTDMASMFTFTELATLDVSGWDTASVTNISYMFSYAKSADPDVSSWDTANVTNMRYVFVHASLADPDVSEWNTANVSNMNGMFAAAKSADPDVSKWDTSKVTNMGKMFIYSTSDPDVSGWDTANVTDMNRMFSGTKSADPDVSKWDTSKVTNMAGIFKRAKLADPDVSAWDTANVTDMSYMFFDAKSADPDVSEWNTANVTDMSRMFYRATSADPDVSGWDTTNVTDMNHMFYEAQSAAPNMSRWDFSGVSCYAGMFGQVTLPTTTYSNILIRIAATSDRMGDELCYDQVCEEGIEEWDELLCGIVPRPLTAGQSKYNAAATVARQELLDRGWRIEDGGQE